MIVKCEKCGGLQGLLRNGSVGCWKCEKASMAEQRIVVPDGMLEAAIDGLQPSLGLMHDTSKVLERALRWRSENPVVPTDEHMNAMVSAAVSKFGIDWQRMNEWERARELCTEFQRRMFLAPEVPEEIREFIFPDTPPDVKERIVEAFHRGLAGSGKR